MTKQVKDVVYHNTIDNITISGTLTLPDKQGGPFPAVFLIAGMGPQDRDYTAVAHKLFLHISDYLTNAGIAVLRVDKRGVDKSTGTFDFSVTSSDLSRDVTSGLAFLKTQDEIDPTRIGLIGHSEGGMIGAMVAAQSKDVAFFISLAGVATTALDDVLEQVKRQLNADGVSEELIAQDAVIRKKVLTAIQQETDNKKAATAIKSMFDDYFTQLPDTLKTESEKHVFTIKESKADMLIAFYNSPSYRYWLQHKPGNDFAKITAPTLALNGSLDFITVSEIQLPIMRTALQKAGNNDITVIEKPCINHWLQKCSSGSIAEYSTLKESISSDILQLIADWINSRFGNSNQK